MDKVLWPNDVKKRNELILDYIKNGDFEINYRKIISKNGSNTAILSVFGDALKIGGVRINVSASLQKKIAELLNCSLLTAKIADLIWSQKEIIVPPFPMPITSSTEAMIEHSEKIDKLVIADGKIVCTTGKHWILTNKSKSANYGWHFTSPLQTYSSSATLFNARVIQGIGTAHDENHVDYSQTCTLVARGCVVNGQSMDLFDLLQNKDLCSLVSHEGPININV